MAILPSKKKLLTKAQVDEILELQSQPLQMFIECLTLTKTLPKKDLDGLMQEFMNSTNVTVISDDAAETERRRDIHRILKRHSNPTDATALKAKLKHVKNLGTLPSITQQILAMIRDPDADLRKIARVVKSDPGLTVRILRLVNSAMFGLRSKVSTIDSCLFAMGLSRLQKLVIADSAFNNFKEVDAMALKEVWTHSVHAGQWARMIGKERGLRGDPLEEAFLAGLLHDIGKLAILQYFPEQAREVKRMVREDMVEEDAERQILDTPWMLPKAKAKERSIFQRWKKPS